MALTLSYCIIIIIIPTFRYIRRPRHSAAAVQSLASHMSPLHMRHASREFTFVYKTCQKDATFDCQMLLDSRFVCYVIVKRDN